METKNNSETVEIHLSQNVYSLVINYQTFSRIHRHVILFSITEDKNLLEEINRFIEYSKPRLIGIYPELSLMQLISFEVRLIPENEYRIAPATASYVGFLREQIVVTPYDVRVCDFFLSDESAHYCNLPF